MSSALMNRYITQDDAAATRDALILQHLPQVRLIARQLHDRVPEHVSLDDLISAGIIGLISAVDHYDPTQNTQLRTYAEYKIRGAILDTLRGMDWAPRRQRKKAKQIEAAIAALQQKLHRAPGEDEIAKALDLDLEEYQKWLVDTRGIEFDNFEQAEDENGFNDPLRHVPDDGENLPSRIFERAELEKLLAQGIESMPELERTVLNLYFIEELGLKEIAAILHSHISRVSVIKSQAILRLRSYIHAHWNTVPPQRSRQ